MPNNIYGYHGWGSICSTEKALYASCSAFRMAHVCPFGKTALFKSVDNGNTWSSPLIVNDTPLDDRDSGIISLGGENLLITWFVHPANVYLYDYFKDFNVNSRKDAIFSAQLDYWAENCTDPALGGSFLRVSKDGGLTFGETIRVPISSPHGPLVTSDKNILYLGKQMYSNEIKEGALAVYKSDLKGDTWEILSYIEIPKGEDANNYHEPHLIELESGRLLAAVRTEHPFSVSTCFSDDKGKTFSPLVSTGIEGSPPHLLLHSSGAVLMSVGRRIKPYGERVYVSFDGGETFDNEYILSDDAKTSDLGYPSTAELPDGSLITAYYQAYKDDNVPSFLYTKWHL
jgi:hypothetical protein